MSHSSSSPSSAYYSAPSASSFVYSPEMLLQFKSNNSSTTSILSKLELHPEIMDDGTIQFRNGITPANNAAESEHSDYSSSNSSNTDDDDDDEANEDSHFIYGDMPSRKDLNWKQLFDLRKVVRAIVHDTLTFSPPTEEYYGPVDEDEEVEYSAPSFTTTAFDSFRSRRTGRSSSNQPGRVPNECPHPAESNRNTQHYPRRSDQYQPRRQNNNNNNNNNSNDWWPRKAPTSAPWRNLERPILVPVAAAA